MPSFAAPPRSGASHGFKTPDALHLAAAVVGGCAAFLTNDAQLARFPGLTVEVV